MNHTFRKDCYVCHGVCKITDDAIAARSRLNAAAPELLELTKELHMYLQMRGAAMTLKQASLADVSRRVLEVLSKVEGREFNAVEALIAGVL